MKYIIDEIQHNEILKDLPVIRMEIDYELLTLYDALQENDKVEIIKTKERLTYLRSQLLKLKKL